MKRIKCSKCKRRMYCIYRQETIEGSRKTFTTVRGWMECRKCEVVRRAE